MRIYGDEGLVDMVKRQSVLWEMRSQREVLEKHSLPNN